MPRILAFAGSARRDSFNKKLVSAAAEMARELGAEVTVVDLADYPMPIYDGDEESENGHPEASNKLYQLMKEHDGFLVACPEYNSSITPLLKNTIDWVSRTRDAEPPLVAFTGKVVALLSASPGALGGMRGLVHVRERVHVRVRVLVCSSKRRSSCTVSAAQSMIPAARSSTVPG